MIVGSQLENAQLEISSDGEESNVKGMIKYNQTSESISVGTGATHKKTFLVDADNMGAFRSAMYPVGSMINSFLSDAQFIAQMDSNWVNVSTLELASNASKKDHFRISKATALGTLLDANGAADDTDTNYVIWANPTGRYLRGGGSTTSPTGAVINSVSNGGTLNNQNLAHTHSEHVREAIAHSYIYDTNSSMIDRAFASLTPNLQTGSNGGSEARPESAVCNIFIKVNE